MGTRHAEAHTALGKEQALPAFTVQISTLSSVLDRQQCIITAHGHRFSSPSTSSCLAELLQRFNSQPPRLVTELCGERHCCSRQLRRHQASHTRRGSEQRGMSSAWHSGAFSTDCSLNLRLSCLATDPKLLFLEPALYFRPAGHTAPSTAPCCQQKQC